MADDKLPFKIKDEPEPADHYECLHIVNTDGFTAFTVWAYPIADDPTTADKELWDRANLLIGYFNPSIPEDSGEIP